LPSSSESSPSRAKSLLTDFTVPRGVGANVGESPSAANIELDTTSPPSVLYPADDKPLILLFVVSLSFFLLIPKPAANATINNTANIAAVTNVCFRLDDVVVWFLFLHFPVKKPAVAARSAEHNELPSSSIVILLIVGVPASSSR